MFKVDERSVWSYPVICLNERSVWSYPIVCSKWMSSTDAVMHEQPACLSAGERFVNKKKILLD